jgi:hypothetical protein
MTTWNACFCLAHIHQPGGSHHPTRYHADNSWVRLESNGYSVHPAVIGQLIELTADLSRLRVSRARPRLTHMLKAPNIRFWLASIEVAK